MGNIGRLHSCDKWSEQAGWGGSPGRGSTSGAPRPRLSRKPSAERLGYRHRPAVLPHDDVDGVARTEQLPPREPVDLVLEGHAGRAHFLEAGLHEELIVEPSRCLVICMGLDYWKTNSFG